MLQKDLGFVKKLLKNVLLFSNVIDLRLLELTTDKLIPLLNHKNK